MAKSTRKNVGFTEWLRVSLLRASRAHFLLLAAYAVVIIAFDATHVLTPYAVMERWIAAAGLLAIVAGTWYLTHNKNNDIPTLKRLLFALIATDLAFASFNVYTQRGMASRAVLLFLIPIIVSALLLNRAAIFAVAAASAAVYIVTTVAYFTLNFNEGYKAELYGEVGFYCAVFFVSAGLLAALVRFGGTTNDA